MRAISTTSMVASDETASVVGRIHDVQSVSVSVPVALPFDRLRGRFPHQPPQHRDLAEELAHRLRRAAHHIRAGRHVRHHAGLRPDARPAPDPQMACQTRLASRP